DGGHCPGTGDLLAGARIDYASYVAANGASKVIGAQSFVEMPPLAVPFEPPSPCGNVTKIFTMLCRELLSNRLVGVDRNEFNFAVRAADKRLPVLRAGNGINRHRCGLRRSGNVQRLDGALCDAAG